MGDWEKRFVFLFIAVFVMILSSGVYARETTDIQDASGSTDIPAKFSDAELEVGAGLGPDSAFYFFDKFFDRFGDDIQIREEKVSEIKDMIHQGKIEDARVALEQYRNSADVIEREADPGSREEALRSAAAIRNAISDLEEEIPEEDREDFVVDVLEREGRISSAVEISSKIKELCEALSGLDPLEYSRICNTDDNSPDWQKKLDRDLTKEQIEEAKKFGKIMQQCFETSGQNCDCAEIPFTDFAQACSIAAPLATACEIGNDENACEQLDNLEMPDLPPHLQDVFDSLDKDISDSQFDLHMPRECQKAGITSPNECRKIMIETNAPEECRAALLKANVQNEREGREICEKIMFELNAPQECVDAGLTDHKECGTFMFRQNAPQECVDAGLTGEQQSDHKKCEGIMKSQQGDGNFNNRGPGNFGGNCREIQNSEERLACYDGALQGTREFKDDYQERFKEDQESIRMCADKCSSQGGAWDFSNGNCECRSGGDFQERHEGDFGGEFRNEEQFREEFQRPSEGFIPPEGEFREGVPPEGFVPPSEPTPTPVPGTTLTPTEPQPTPSPTPEPIPVSFRITGNAFLKYYYR